MAILGALLGALGVFGLKARIMEKIPSFKCKGVLLCASTWHTGCACVLSGLALKFSMNKYCKRTFIFYCFQGLALLWLFAASLTWAADKASLFDVSIAVPSESAKEKRMAAKKALERVFVRMTGDENILRTYPELKRYTANTDSYIASFTYRQVPKEDLRASDVLFQHLHALSARDEKNAIETQRNEYVSLNQSVEGVDSSQEAANQLVLELSFLPEQVFEWMKAAAIPVWQSQRPKVLIWLTLQTQGERQFVAEEKYPAVIDLIEKKARDRALPVIFPLYDLEEQIRLPVDELWNFSLDAIVDESSKYASAAILVGRLSVDDLANITGEWMLVAGGAPRTYSYAGKETEEFLYKGVDLAVDFLARSYAIRHDAGSEIMTLQVEGVEQYTQYLALYESLKSVTSLNQLQLTYIDNGLVFFHFNSAADISKLRAVIELDTRLHWIDRGSGHLNYYWRENK